MKSVALNALILARKVATRRRWGILSATMSRLLLFLLLRSLADNINHLFKDFHVIFIFILFEGQIHFETFSLKGVAI